MTDEARIKDPWYVIDDDDDEPMRIVTCTGGCGELVRSNNPNECECSDCFGVSHLETLVAYGHELDEDERNYAVECRSCKEPESMTCRSETRKFRYEDNGEHEIEVHIPVWSCSKCGGEFYFCEDWYLITTVLEHCTIDQANEYLDGRKLWDSANSSSHKEE